MANNYVRIGNHPNMRILTFNDKDPEQVRSVKEQIMALTGGRIAGITIGQWKRCEGLDYPLVGEPARVVYWN